MCLYAGGSLRALACTADDWPMDPRLPVLGRRNVLQADNIPPQSAHPSSDGISGYQAWRISQGVAEGGDEIPTGRCVKHEEAGRAYNQSAM